MFFNVRSVSPAGLPDLAADRRGPSRRPTPSSIGQLPAALHANHNGTVPSYSGNSGNSGSGNTGNTGGVLYGD